MGYGNDNEAVDLLGEIAAEKGIERWQKIVATRLTQKYRLPELDYICFENIPWRFALLSFDPTAAMIRQAGLFNLSNSISLLSPEDLNTVVQQLGQDTFRTTVDFAPVMQGASFELTARVPKNWMSDVTGSADTMGWFTFGSVFFDAPKSIVKRIELKVPKDASEAFRAGRKKPLDAPGRIADFLLRILKNSVDRNEALCVF